MVGCCGCEDRRGFGRDTDGSNASDLKQLLLFILSLAGTAGWMEMEDLNLRIPQLGINFVFQIFSSLFSYLWPQIFEKLTLWKN